MIFKLPSGHLLLTYCIYHPPKPTYQPADFLLYLTHLMDNALDQHPGLTMVAGGDVNRLDTNELIVMIGWDSLVDFPTRGDAYLDKIFTNRPDLFAKSIPYFVSIQTGTKLKPIRQNVRIRDCRRHRKEGLYLKLVSENWDSVLNLNDVEEAVNNLEAKIKHHMDECMPLRSVRMSSRDPVWMTPLVKSLKRVKSRIAPSNKDRLAEVNRKISELISKNRRTLAKAPVGSREWWKHADNLSQRRSISANVTLDTKSLEELNDYFADLCTDDAYTKPVPATVDKSLEAPQISERHVWKCLQHLKKTAMGPDLIPFWIWRDHAEIFIHQVSFIRSGMFP